MASRQLKTRALEKLAALSAVNPPPRASGDGDLARIYSFCPSRSHSGVPNGGHKTPNGVPDVGDNLSGVLMKLDELHALLALCKAAPKVRKQADADRLQSQLAIYLLEAHAQKVAPSPFLSRIEPSPWEALTYNLVSALLTIGIRHPILGRSSHGSIRGYLNKCEHVSLSSEIPSRGSLVTENEAHKEGIIRFATLAVSLLGFMEAAAGYCYFFDIKERTEIISSLRKIMSENFMVAIEGAFSLIRTSEEPSKELKDWKQFTKRYAVQGRPLGAMLLERAFMKFLAACSSLEVADVKELQKYDVHHLLRTSKRPISIGTDDSDLYSLVDLIADIAEDKMRLLEDGADYLQLGSAWQQQLAFAVKRYTLTAFLNCMLVDEGIADADLLIGWLEETMNDPSQMGNSDLAITTLESLAIVAKQSPAFATALSRNLPRFIVQGRLPPSTLAVASRSLAHILQQLSTDAVITGLYSLGNVLSTSSGQDKGIASLGSRGSVLSPKNGSKSYAQHDTGSAISLDLSSIEDTSLTYGNVVCAVVGVAAACNDEKIAALALSMLLQKLGRIGIGVDLAIIVETARLAAAGGSADLKSLLKLYVRLSHEGTVKENLALVNAVSNAHAILARSLQPGSPAYLIFWEHILEAILSKGDVLDGEKAREADVDIAAREISHLFRPWAMVVAASFNMNPDEIDETIIKKQREAWFNVIVHGITPGTRLYEENLPDLRTLALYSRPLIPEDRAGQPESDLELNTVLRRGMTAQHTTEMKKRLTKHLPNQESNIRGLTYPRVIFVLATYTIETLRAECGHCASVLTYFVDPSVNRTEMGNCVNAVADRVLSTYLRKLLTERASGSLAPFVAKELALILRSCCHRLARVQAVAYSFADRLISQVPSSLCQKSSLFTLLELLTLMWSSCLEEDIDEYEWRSNHHSSVGKISVQLSDDYQFRRTTLDAFHQRCRGWMMMVINVAPLDVKGLLQTYLSDYDDDGAYGHIALGRSFALDMGSIIPATDQRLGAIPRQDQRGFNTGSDFIAQYTTRQEYRYADPVPDHDAGWMKLLQSDGLGDTFGKGVHTEIEEVRIVLAVLAQRIAQRKFVSIDELRDILRRAAALLCRSKSDQAAILQHLVGIPFALFTKQSIKLGISLWLGIINENPRMEPRIMVEVAASWERTIQQKQGIFSPDQVLNPCSHSDPFYIKEEFAPSDKPALLKRQQTVQNTIAPHFRILQFLLSHFNANRLGSPHLRRILSRMMRKTLSGLKHSQGHPLTREAHFHVVLFAIRILRFSDDLGEPAKWRLKDRILSASLAWFSHPPRWSFGGNRLQTRAEAQILGDVKSALSSIASIGSAYSPSLQLLTEKQDLLSLLLDDEQQRLQVWLNPLEQSTSNRFSILNHPHSSANDANAANLVKTAWSEDPSIAIHLPARFQTPSVIAGIRKLLLEEPHRALKEPEGLSILFSGGELTRDITFQTRFLLYWAPVNPVTAATFFLPAYSNHPFVLQYGMRALESHSVDVTFFYVPQIVQLLRYDKLGYVAQYIVETAKFSQLFAHQIIWNMKANSYKDDDATIEDGIKPTLDAVQTEMISAFSGTDKAFYEREFAFFNEVTSISGKLRPFIKQPKEEKKQKIEEELRQIKVEVGVYLPSNPDGVVVGIDRKSGKPLQSHAKAPFMATFRIKKTRSEEMESTDNMLEKTNQNEEDGGQQGAVISQEATYEVFQSAIFKVGDDCRQDVLALQMIAAFRGIFNSVGLDVYVYPYRVTATAPGCGVIDVLPASISRDMLGREAVNGLYDYFVSTYGGEESVRFQAARNNFVKSMAAYSIISYLLQFKDRHNGNIMVDEAGHILHIDFGFIFDIAPGGIKFERAPFKLTSEMIAVMGGAGEHSQSWRWFEELCVKAFLAVRLYADKLCHMVQCMVDSGLPCFKPETVKHLRERFVLERGESETRAFVRYLIEKSKNSYSTGVYDGFQLLTNGIPY
ncbi:phosphatidylinositol-4- kinase [Agyrium rufum]|nr:phosphatidylinositol-4- kinase [Agyrium rufum]